MFLTRRGNCSSCKLLSTHTHTRTHIYTLTHTQLLLQCDDWQHHSEHKGEWFFFSHKLILRLSLSHILTLRCRRTLGREGTYCQVVLRLHSSFSNPLSLPLLLYRLPHFHPLRLVALCPPRLGSTTQVLHCGRLATWWERRGGETAGCEAGVDEEWDTVEMRHTGEERLMEE